MQDEAGEAERRIRQAAQDGTGILDLVQLGLTAVPESVGNLTSLTRLDLSGNPLANPPPEVVAAGMSAVLEFLRALRDGGAEQWVSKMLVVGEPMVGKTSVTKALCDLPYDRDEPPTHGVHLDPLDLPHPSRAGTVMRLNVWDFGGQLEYRATQRFYLTDRSLFMLVWNPRVGSRSAGGRVAEWLQAIRAVAPGSPVVIVATHCTQDEAPYDLDEEGLRREYPQIAAITRCRSRGSTYPHLLLHGSSPDRGGGRPRRSHSSTMS